MFTKYAFKYTFYYIEIDETPGYICGNISNKQISTHNGQLY